MPFAALSTEEVTSVDVDRASRPRNGIGHRVDNIASERFRVLLAQRPGTSSLYLAVVAGDAAPAADVSFFSRATAS